MSDNNNDNSKIGAALLVGVFSTIVGCFMANIWAGLVLGFILFIFLITHD